MHLLHWQHETVWQWVRGGRISLSEHEAALFREHQGGGASAVHHNCNASWWAGGTAGTAKPNPCASVTPAVIGRDLFYMREKELALEFKISQEKVGFALQGTRNHC